MLQHSNPWPKKKQTPNPTHLKKEKEEEWEEGGEKYLKEATFSSSGPLAIVPKHPSFLVVLTEGDSAPSGYFAANTSVCCCDSGPSLGVPVEEECGPAALEL